MSAPLAGRRRRPSAPRSAAQDVPLHDPTRTGVLLASVNVTLYSLMSLAAWAAWGGWHTAAETGTNRVLTEALAITAVNFVYGMLVVGGTFLLHPQHWRARVRYPLIAAMALAVALPRTLAMGAIYSIPADITFFLAEWAAGAAAGFVAVAAGLLAAELAHRARTEEAHHLRAARRAAKAVDELQSEEMRVRRMVADRLHGTLQYRLVTVTAGLDGVAAALDSGATLAQAAAELREWAERLEEIREEEVRSLSHAVFPAGIELGTVRALEMMLRRLPPQIQAHLEIGPALQRLVDEARQPIPPAERLIAVYTVEEGITNALKHGRASRLWLAADVLPTDDPLSWVLDVTIDDDGDGITQPAPELSGLSRHAARLEARGGSLDLRAGPRGGARLWFRLPFTQSTQALDDDGGAGAGQAAD
ncbi:putative signal transduction histidine kinase [Xylanimonas cellulosilytica DSM 15894]|uniref:Signal transduction histidine kinase n=1 Tax=Xylanimonas cellulosilytica (strain DSM 15894 / JCM 12276 / CECT 5975 / KCTC 9989 / LMG 20990 / NBRC 107835 / XIL07) TaxID=446471 RepID=D1BU13_XYLCX|nr:signal transduction histidine kinase [Xylanimonas cellulosilytica]ACZ29177.1 putative signal transduction histidine kinase [Xylanimonas cellulosilytica DSM 15894]